MPDALLPEIATAYGPLAALALYLWVNRQKPAPAEDVSKEIREALRRIEADITTIKAILSERRE